MIRRVVAATINYDHPQRGFEHALEGVFGRDNVCPVDYLERQRQTFSKDAINTMLLGVLENFHPDWLWLQVQDTDVIAAETLLEARRRWPSLVITHWTGDARPSVSPYLASICAATHVTFASSIEGLDQFRSAGAKRAEYLQIGLDWEEDVIGLPDWTPPFRVPEVVFCGNYYAQFPGAAQRREAIRTLQEAGIDVGIVGGAWPEGSPVVGACTVKQQHHVWKRARVALNINNFNNLVGYYSDRQLIAMASGTPVVCYAIPGLGIEFEHGKHLLSYRTLDELLSAVQMLLSDDVAAKRIGRAGRAEVIRHHTWFSRILQALPVVEEVQVSL